MSWASAIKERPVAQAARRVFVPTTFETEIVDWARLVTLDFESYYDIDYTLNKLSTSEYIRDPRFKAQMVGLNIGGRKTKVFPAARIKTELRKISWETHSLLAHNSQFDAFILSHHYGIKPKKIYCTLSMARGLHSNEIGAGLDEVSKFYGGQGKIEGGLEPTKGVLNWPPALVKSAGLYCANDVDECLRVFKLMVPQMPRDEVDLIDLTVKMFTDPILLVDIDRVKVELARELKHRRDLLLSISKLCKLDDPALIKSCTRTERELQGEERTLFLVRKIIGSNERFADLLRSQGVDPPRKISPAWMKKPAAERDPALKYSYAFAKDDQAFITLPDEPERWTHGLNLNKKASVMELAIREARIRALVETRLAVKSTTNITRAERFLTAGADGMPLPCGYSYYRAHTGRMGGNNKMNMQNLTRGGELRASILAPKGHQIVVADSSQIEARVNGWLWGQQDLLDAFADSDRGIGRDVYCLMADIIYGRHITKVDTTERFVGKVSVLGLGFQLGPMKLQMTLAKGALGGPPVFFTLKECEEIVNKYRRKNYRIEQGWRTCKMIIEQMAAGIAGSYKCITWDANVIYLPNGMTLKYPDLRKALNPEKGFEEWTYQAGANRKKIYGGLLCVGASTEVLTNYGWKPIIEVRSNDLVWDGLNWVSHSGVEFRGVKKTLNFGGVHMTPDHQILVDEHWHEAQHTSHSEATSSFTRHYRTSVRNVDCGESRGVRRPTYSMVAHLRLREAKNVECLRVHEGIHEVMRLFDTSHALRSTYNPRDESSPCVSCVAQHDCSMHSTNTSSLGELRRSRNHSLQELDEIRTVLERYGSEVCFRSNFRTKKKSSRLQQKQLRVGDLQGASEQSTQQQQEEPVFDLIDVGPLRRFTVRGCDGQPFIIHNCENIVQALARIIVVGDQMLKISRKHRVVMTTHDEIVTCVKTAQASSTFTYMVKTMSTAPAWCQDIPLNAAGGFASNYSK